ncbi:MAG: SAM-dependent DNA methyltransferase, partial [Anaerolineales bacterium]|nr:SAM-dependent DNA methyltransferase [Anaerolineales bacterium]
MDIEAKVWSICDILRADGMHIGTYIEQLTVLLFLKMLDEQQAMGSGVPLPGGFDWQTLRSKQGLDLLNYYAYKLLPKLAEQSGVIGDIFARVNNQFREPVNLRRAIDELEEVNWSALEMDVKGAIYESLLERYAREAKGAGQYFTPRSAIRAAVRVIAPRASEDIHDPAAGTGGFQIGAYEHILARTHGGAVLKREERRRLKSQTFSGGELVAETRRLALMNLALHGIEPEYFYLGDSLGPGSHTERRYEVVMTNPPYGGRLQRPPNRTEFVVESRSSELNFVMHVASILRHDRGRAVMVVPDGVLFQSGEAQRVREMLLEDCDVHTILALPQNAFVPYTGVQTNLTF